VSNQTKSERKSDREFVVTRTINGPAHLVFEAWANPEIFKKWWVPKSAPMTLESCEMDVRTGGGYKLVFQMNSQKFEFFGKYVEVTPPKRMVWTNDEGGEDTTTVTTVTFQEVGKTTIVVVHELYPSKQALDEAIQSGSTSGYPEQLDQLEDLLAEQGR
jgi:uncharacterized protein YndB with AHSA1/START domain